MVVEVLEAEAEDLEEVAKSAVIIAPV